MKLWNRPEFQSEIRELLLEIEKETSRQPIEIEMHLSSKVLTSLNN